MLARVKRKAIAAWRRLVALDRAPHPPRVRKQDLKDTQRACIIISLALSAQFWLFNR
ncbi:MAG: hypothetical protein WBF58_20865 [Xanthobacteraceae bacterium]